MTVLVRGKGDPSTLLREVRDTVRAMDHTVPLCNVTTMARHVGSALAPARAEAVVMDPKQSDSFVPFDPSQH